MPRHGSKERRIKPVTKLRHSYTVKPAQYAGFDLHHGTIFVKHFAREETANAFINMLLGRDHE